MKKAMRAKLKYLVLMLGACAGLHAASIYAQAGAAGYPSKPIRVIVPLAPGGPSDILVFETGDGQDRYRHARIEQTTQSSSNQIARRSIRSLEPVSK